jgi:hypothetical protein
MKKNKILIRKINEEKNRREENENKQKGMKEIGRVDH